MAKIEDELFIISGAELEDLKKYANSLLYQLPKDPMKALLTIVFLKEHMEKVLDRKVEGIRIH